MGRPSNWNSPTDSVRLPKHAIPACMALARQLDDPKPLEHVKNNVQNPPGPSLLTSDGPQGTYRLFLKPPRDLPPLVEASIDAFADKLFAELNETERIFVLGRLVEELGERVES